MPNLARKSITTASSIAADAKDLVKKAAINEPKLRCVFHVRRADDAQ